MVCVCGRAQARLEEGGLSSSPLQKYINQHWTRKMEIIRSGFDKLELALNAYTPRDLEKVLEPAKEVAKRKNQLVPILFNGVQLLVRGHGTGGGYTYSCDGGKMGANWFFKTHTAGGGWGVRIAVRALPLVLNGMAATKADLEDKLDRLGIKVLANGVAISRVDYAVDCLLPGFRMVPENFVVHSNMAKSRYLEAEEMESNSTSWHENSVRVGGINRKQIGFYNKRKEVTKKLDRTLPTIWDNIRAQQGKRPLVYFGPEADEIWRVEPRAGKEYLKGRWRVTGWGSLFDALPNILQEIMSTMRYSEPTSDSNRSRWPNHPLWDMAVQEIDENLMSHVPSVPPERIIEGTRSAKIELLEIQRLGLSVALAVLNRVPAARFEDFLREHSNRDVQLNATHGRDLSVRIADAERRYADLL